MNNSEDLTNPEGAREKRIYKIDTFVNQDGFKIEEHRLTDDAASPPQFYGFYLVNTEIGPIDRYFKFKNEATVEECFDSFKEMAEEDAKNLSQAMQREAERQEKGDRGAPPPEVRSAPQTRPAPMEEPPQVSPPPVDRDTEVLDAEGLPI